MNNIETFLHNLVWALRGRQGGRLWAVYKNPNTDKYMIDHGFGVLCFFFNKGDFSEIPNFNETQDLLTEMLARFYEATSLSEKPVGILTSRAPNGRVMYGPHDPTYSVLVARAWDKEDDEQEEAYRKVLKDLE